MYVHHLLLCLRLQLLLLLVMFLAEGEAATSLVLQDDVISVLGAEGDKFRVVDVPADVPR